jgi:micrococcal nuclease
MVVLLPFAAAIALCGGGPRHTCVIDGDTFWLNGAKIRLADINAPETTQAACPAERAAGEAAKRRLAELLSAGPFRLETRGRATDRYGRALRVVTRQGRSLGAQLVAEGHAEVWQGQRGNWCLRLSRSLPNR